MVYNYVAAVGTPVPIMISVPHCGTEFPVDLKGDYKAALIESPDDTDWYVDRLYDFAPAMGISMITARYSRWVIDLNRDPASTPLYSDGRIITGLCPTTTFLGEPLYRDERTDLQSQDVEGRLENYYNPYHQRIQKELELLKAKFGEVLLWDCHSIRQVVSTIQKDKFPDLILGDADGRSASSELVHQTLAELRSGNYSLNHNTPFKGGAITRSFGKPSENQQALQLEMTKVNYMNDRETDYDQGRAGRMRNLLQHTFDKLIHALTTK